MLMLSRKKAAGVLVGAIMAPRFLLSEREGDRRFDQVLVWAAHSSAALTVQRKCPAHRLSRMSQSRMSQSRMSQSRMSQWSTVNRVGMETYGEAGNELLLFQVRELVEINVAVDIVA
jgi:hypothetical protein